MTALLVYLLSGLLIARRLLPDRRLAVRVWMGLVFGCVLLMWLPCLFAFFFGFSLTAQYSALALSAILSLLSLCFPSKGREYQPLELSLSEMLGLLLSLALTAFCAWLLHTHILFQKADGSLWVGQSTYGDLAMHLGFIESLFRQGHFPPEYSIFPGQQLNYPFLVDAASASLRFFSLSLRASVILPSVLMLFCAFWGFWIMADRITAGLCPTLMAWLLFFFNGGFGFALFLGKYPFSTIFKSFYKTPTNFLAEDIRWVNVICDMLIPQRTTMAGWCMLLAAIYLLLEAIRLSMAGKGRREILLLAVLASSMPMIHTHSFLTLGILSAVWYFCALPEAKRTGKASLLTVHYVLYGLICFALALPQLLKWTMDSVGTGNLLHLHLGWVVGAKGILTNWFLFYAVNCGIVFLAMWPAAICLRREKLRIFLGAAVIFVLSNLVVFQPNLYDNNKLLYVWFMLTDILVCDWLCCCLRQLNSRPMRASLACFLLVLGVLSGVLSLIRESVSKYPLFSRGQTEAADYIVHNTDPDSLFLTGTNHNNTVSVLTGRSIVCGPGLYLFYHGVNYQQRQATVKKMYEGGEFFCRNAAALGVDYVYISSYERSSFHVDEQWFANTYPLVYDHAGIRIYQITKMSSGE